MQKLMCDCGSWHSLLSIGQNLEELMKLTKEPYLATRKFKIIIVFLNLANK